jgi:hypothetical protein
MEEWKWSLLWHCADGKQVAIRSLYVVPRIVILSVQFAHKIWRNGIKRRRRRRANEMEQ